MAVVEKRVSAFSRQSAGESVASFLSASKKSECKEDRKMPAKKTKKEAKVAAMIMKQNKLV